MTESVCVCVCVCVCFWGGGDRLKTLFLSNAIVSKKCVCGGGGGGD